MRTTAFYNTIKIQRKDLILGIGQHRYMCRNLKVYDEMDAHEQMNFEKRYFGLAIYNVIMGAVMGGAVMFGAHKLFGLDKLLL